MSGCGKGGRRVLLALAGGLVGLGHAGCGGATGSASETVPDAPRVHVPERLSGLLPADCEGALSAQPSRLLASPLFPTLVQAVPPHLQRRSEQLSALARRTRQAAACLVSAPERVQQDLFVVAQGEFRHDELPALLTLATQIWDDAEHVEAAPAVSKLFGQPLVRNGRLAVLSLPASRSLNTQSGTASTLLVGPEARVRSVVEALAAGRLESVARQAPFRTLADRVQFERAGVAVVHRPLGAPAQQVQSSVAFLGSDARDAVRILASSSVAARFELEPGLRVTALAALPNAAEAERLVGSARSLMGKGHLALRLAGLGALVEGTRFEADGPLARVGLSLDEATVRELLSKFGAHLAGVQGTRM